MHPDKLEDIFHAALEIESAQQRSDFVEQMCCQDDQLRQQLEDLLESHRAATGFLEQSPSITLSDSEDQVFRTEDQGSAKTPPLRPMYTLLIECVHCPELRVGLLSLLALILRCVAFVA